MTETKPDEILNGTEHTPNENHTVTAEQQEQTANDTTLDFHNKPDAPPFEATVPDVADTPPAPDAPDKADGDGDKAVPSNLIEGVFGEKQTAAKEAESLL